jgi:transposase
MKNSLLAVYTSVWLRGDRLIAEIHKVGVSFINKTFKTHQDRVSAVHYRSGAAFLLDEEELETLQAAVEICPDATLDELQRIIADQCRTTVSQMSICTALKN